MSVIVFFFIFFRLQVQGIYFSTILPILTLLWVRNRSCNSSSSGGGGGSITQLSMENGKQVGASASSSSFTVDLFGPKDSSKSSSSSTSLFGSVFGPSSTGLGKDSYHPGIMGASRNQDSGCQYGNAKAGNSDYMYQKNRGESGGRTSKERNSIYQNETAEPCYFSSSIHYGGQEVYSSTAQSTNTQYTLRKDGSEDDPNGNNSASRGNWWQGSLYY